MVGCLCAQAVNLDQMQQTKLGQETEVILEEVDNPELPNGGESCSNGGYYGGYPG